MRDIEPDGLAGNPIMNAVDSKNRTNILIVAVRYFGGTLLEVTVLLNACTSATAIALQLGFFIQYPIEITYQLQFDYTMMNEVMLIVKQLNCSIIKQDYQLFKGLEIDIPKARLQAALDNRNKFHRVELKPTVF